MPQHYYKGSAQTTLPKEKEKEKAEHITVENDQFIKIGRKRRGRKPMGSTKQI